MAGIFLGHPGLTLEVEGHTDSVGGEAYNQNLSEQRAGSVRDYLILQGISGMNSVPAKGFGESQPVATNDTAAGRSSIGAWNSLSPANSLVRRSLHPMSPGKKR